MSEEKLLAGKGLPVQSVSERGLSPVRKSPNQEYPFHPAPQPRQPGYDAGQVVIAADFDEPLTDFDDARDQ